MSNEITFKRDSSLTYFVTIRDLEDSLKVWYGSTFETWGTGSRTLADYGISGSEVFGNGVYAVDMPAGINTAKLLLIEVYKQIGVSPADDDWNEGGFVIDWNGSSEILITNGNIITAIAALNNLSSAQTQVAAQAAIDASALATAANLQIVDNIVDYLKKLAECDTKLDISGTPYLLLKLEKGTDTEILRKQLKDPDGTNIAASGVVVGQHIHTASP